MSEKVSFELPEAQEKWEGFKNHPALVPLDVQVATGKDSKKTYVRYRTEEEGSIHVAMPAEITGLVNQIRNQYEPQALKDLPKDATEDQKAEALWKLVKSITPVRKEGVNELPRKGDKVVWMENPIGRTEDGLFV